MDYPSNVSAGIQGGSQVVSLRMQTHLLKRSPVAADGARPGAVLYARVSSKEQELGYSIPAQQELLRPLRGPTEYPDRSGVLGRRDCKDHRPPWIYRDDLLPQAA